MKCRIQTPDMLNPDGEHDLSIDTGCITLSGGEEKCFSYYMLVQESAHEDINIVTEPDSFQAFEGNKRMEQINHVPIKINAVSVLPDELITREVGKLSLEMQNLAGVREYIRLADILRSSVPWEVQNYIETRKMTEWNRPAVS